MSNPLKAFSHGISKEEFLNELRKHYEADNFIQGSYYSKSIGKGCAVGCSVKSINDIRGKYTAIIHYGVYAAIGIPEWLAQLEETIFEGLDIEAAKEWPIQFTEAINTGAELDTIKAELIDGMYESESVNEAAETMLDRIRKCKPTKE